VKRRLYKEWSKLAETRRNKWKYKEFKSMPHYESLHVYEASTDTVLSLSHYECNK